MYRCRECGKRFVRPRRLYENHGHGFNMVEALYGCPFCKSGGFYEIRERFCKACGREIYGFEDYCSDECAAEGERLYAREREYRLMFAESEVAKAVREVNDYNKAHGTKYSYGQYFLLKGEGKL